MQLAEKQSMNPSAADSCVMHERMERSPLASASVAFTSTALSWQSSSWRIASIAGWTARALSVLRTDTLALVMPPDQTPLEKSAPSVGHSIELHVNAYRLGPEIGTDGAPYS